MNNEQIINFISIKSACIFNYMKTYIKITLKTLIKIILISKNRTKNGKNNFVNDIKTESVQGYTKKYMQVL